MIHNGFIAFPKSENILIWIEPSKQLENERSVLSALQLTDDEVAQAGAMIGTFGLIQEHLRFEGELEMVDYGSVNLSVLDSNILKGKFRWLYDRYGFVDFMPK